MLTRLSVTRKKPRFASTRKYASLRNHYLLYFTTNTLTRALLAQYSHILTTAQRPLQLGLILN